MITIIDGVFNPSITGGQVIAIAIISMLVPIAFYVLRSIGLYVMARRREIKHAFLAWIPLVWVYIACKLIGKVKFWGKPIEKLAIIFCVIFGVSELANFVYNAFIYFPLIGNYLMGKEISILMIDESMADISQYVNGLTRYWGMPEVYYGSDFVNPYRESLPGIISFLNILSYVAIPFDIAAVVVIIVVYVNLFKKYLPQHYMLATVMSVLGLFAPFVFAVRKREPINYIDYLRSRYNRYGYGPYGNPYGQQGPQQKQPEHPFSEFAEKNEVDPGDPFKEFSDDKKDE